MRLDERVTSLCLWVRGVSLTVVFAYRPNSSAESQAFFAALGGSAGFILMPMVERIIPESESEWHFGASHGFYIMTMFKHMDVHWCSWHQDTLGRR